MNVKMGKVGMLPESKMGNNENGEKLVILSALWSDKLQKSFLCRKLNMHGSCQSNYHIHVTENGQNQLEMLDLGGVQILQGSDHNLIE